MQMSGWWESVFEHMNKRHEMFPVGCNTVKDHTKPLWQLQYVKKIAITSGYKTQIQCNYATKRVDLCSLLQGYEQVVCQGVKHPTKNGY